LNGVTTGASTPRMRWLGDRISVSGMVAFCSGSRIGCNSLGHQTRAITQKIVGHRPPLQPRWIDPIPTRWGQRVPPCLSEPVFRLGIRFSKAVFHW
jgi:hypothetical protein